VKKRVKNKKKKELHNNLFAVTSFWLLVLMVLVTLGGIAVFKIQINAVEVPEEDENYTVYDKYFAMITSDDKADFWQDVYAGAKQEGEAEGDYVEFFAGDMGTGYSVEERMEIAIDSKVDGIIVEGNDVLTLRRKIVEANANGIPVVVVNQDLTDSERISFVGIGRYDLGQTYGRQACELAEKMLQEEAKNGETTQKKLRVMVLTGQEPDSNGQNLLISGIREEIAKDETLTDRIVLETYPIDDSGSFAAEEAIRDIFVGKENVPDILICLNEIHTSCAYQAVIDYNRVGITNIIGYYDSETILNGVDKEIIYSTISMDAEQMGRYCAAALSEYLDTGYVSEYFTVDTYVINHDNVREYLGEEEE
jgi:ribose transport system substrate-binding protein